MNCMNCDGSLVYRQTFDHPLDENGVYLIGNEYTIDVDGVFCGSCGAEHDYETLMSDENGATVALLTNRDPHPVATLALSFENGEVKQMDSKVAIALVVLDEDEREVALFMVRPREESEFLARATELMATVKKGEWKARY